MFRSTRVCRRRGDGYGRSRLPPWRTARVPSACSTTGHNWIRSALKHRDRVLANNKSEALDVYQLPLGAAHAEQLCGSLRQVESGTNYLLRRDQCVVSCPRKVVSVGCSSRIVVAGW